MPVSESSLGMRGLLSSSFCATKKSHSFLNLSSVSYLSLNSRKLKSGSMFSECFFLSLSF